MDDLIGNQLHDWNIHHLLQPKPKPASFGDLSSCHVHGTAGCVSKTLPCGSEKKTVAHLEIGVMGKPDVIPLLMMVNAC